MIRVLLVARSKKNDSGRWEEPVAASRHQLRMSVQVGTGSRKVANDTIVVATDVVKIETMH